MTYEPRHVLKIVTHILDNCRPRPQAAVRVWAALQLNTGPGFEVVIDRNHVAHHAGVSIDDVSRALASLEQAGVLTRMVQGNTRKDGGLRRRGRTATIVQMRKFW